MNSKHRGCTVSTARWSGFRGPATTCRQVLKRSTGSGKLHRKRRTSITWVPHALQLEDGLRRHGSTRHLCCLSRQQLLLSVQEQSPHISHAPFQSHTLGCFPGALGADRFSKHNTWALPPFYLRWARVPFHLIKLILSPIPTAFDWHTLETTPPRLLWEVKIGLCPL